MIKLFIYSLSFLTVSNLLAQADDLFQTNKSRYPDEPGVFLNRQEVLSILAEGDSLNVYSVIEEDLLILKEQSGSFSTRKVYGSSFFEVSDLSARTLVWEKNKYKPIEVKEFKKNSDPGRSVFYDDSYNFSFNFPSVAPNCRTYFKYTEHIKDVKFIGGYNFGTYLNQNRTSYSIKTSRGVELYYKVVNDPENKIKLTITEKNGIINYDWTASNLPKLKTEEASPSIRYYAPQVICYVKSYQTKKGRKNVISSLDDLYAWYFTFIENLNTDTSEELVKIVNDIKKNSSNEEDLVRQVFYWVQSNIQYVAFEEGMRGLIPHSGSYVCEKRFGDCKDMASLIVNMLKIADVKSYFTWIGTRDIPFKYSELPTPLVDNHMIATYISPLGRYYFLDATGDFTPFGLPTSMIQGKEALISFDSIKYEVRTVPIIDGKINAVYDSIKVKIADNAINGSGFSSFKGYPKSFRAYELSRKDNNKEYVAALLGKGSNKFYLDEFKVHNLKDNDKSTVIDYSFRIGDYYQAVGNEIYLNLNFSKDFYNEYINIDSRHLPIESEYLTSQNEFVEFEIPPDYELDYLPGNSKLEHPLLNYSIQYEKIGNKILYNKNIEVKYLLLTPENFKSWNEAVNHISNAYRESVILKRK